MAKSDMEKAFGAFIQQYFPGGPPNQGNGGQGPANPWAPPGASAEVPQFAGISIPVSIEAPFGKVQVYFSLPPEAATDYGAIVAAICRLKEMGLYVVTRKEFDGNGGNRYGQPNGGFRPRYNGGYQNGGGNYGNGGYRNY